MTTRSWWSSIYGVYAALMFVVVILLMFCPVLILAPTLALRRAIGRGAVRAWLMTCFVPFRVNGVATLPAATCVVVCNHASYVDGILLTAALPARFTFLVQDHAADWPYVGLIIRKMGVRFVNREDPLEAARALSELVDQVRSGESMAIFPEGTFDDIAELKSFYDGAFLISARTGASIVPAVIKGTRFFFGDGQSLPRWNTISLDILPAIVPGDSATRGAVRKLRDRTREAIAERCGEPMSLRSDRSTRSE